MQKRKYKRLENGFGSVVKLAGNRRRPYVARLSASHNATGTNTPKALGYFETWAQAYEALLAYNKSPYDLGKAPTFADVFKMTMQRKENAPGGMSASVRAGHNAAFARSAPLHDIPIKDIKAPTLQNLLDGMTSEIGFGTLQNMRLLWLQMWRLADEYELVEKNIAKFVRLNKEYDVKHSEPFTPAEVRLLFDKSDDIRAARLLVMCLSGFRIAEYSIISVDIESKTFSGGLKTNNGRRRVVPMHSAIVPLVGRLTAENKLFSEKHYAIRNAFKADLLALGIEPKNHTPHDCRATFASLLTAAGVPDLHIKRMLGHSARDLTKDVYTEIFIDDLRASIEKIIL